MRTFIAQLAPRVSRPAATLTLALAFAAPAAAQSFRPETPQPVMGERYHIEASGTLWNPALFGVISSEQFGIVGDQIDFVNDLGYKTTRFKDLRIVLRPSKKSRFRLQYTPVTYTAETTFNRDIVFNGIKFGVAVPVNSTFGWKVWRFGYEYDFIYKSRGFVGFLLEGRYTDFTAELASALTDPQFTRARGPLPAIGLVGRVYPLKELAINFEVSGFKLPDIDPKYQANYFDWDIYGTINLHNNAGVQVGWRKMTTYLGIENDFGDLRFQGMWFGAAIRY